MICSHHKGWRRRLYASTGYMHLFLFNLCFAYSKGYCIWLHVVALTPMTQLYLPYLNYILILP